MKRYQGAKTMRRIRENEGRVTGGSVGRLCLVAVAAVLLSPAIGEAVLPGFRAPMLTEPATIASYLARLSQGTNTQGPSVNDAEIQELARGLRYDPGLMYKFVHDHIRFTPTWGETKGAYMTWMDRSGNGFDQATLLIALLTHAASAPDAPYTITNIQYGVGEIELTAEQFTKWFGIPDSNDIARQILARGGFYGAVTADGNYIGSVKLVHVWVKATIDGTARAFDPSFKSHTVKGGILHLSNAMGYDRESFLADAERAGGGWNTDNIRADLDTYSQTLVNSIKSQVQAGDVNDALEDIVGGKRIEPVEESALPPQFLPYTSTLRQSFAIGSIRSIYRTTVRIQHCGIDKTFYSSNIYGRRLSLKYNGSNQPQLILDGEPVATGTATTPGNWYDLTITVDHPCEVTDFDATATLRIKAGGFYHIVNGWGDTGTKILLKHRGLLQQYKLNGYSDTSEEVLGESYALVGLTWLAETAVMRGMAAETVDSTITNHHILGVAGQYDAPYTDLALGHLGVVDHGSSDDPEEIFYVVAGHAAAYEQEVLASLQDCNAVSTGRLIEMANDRQDYNDILGADSSNWSTVQQQLVGYSQAEKDLVSTYISGGFSVTLPEYGDLTKDDWTGMGFRAKQISGATYAMAYIVGDGYKGGVSCTEGSLNSSTLLDGCFGAASDGDPEGAYGTGSTDIAIGSGGFPFGLAFGRQYSSHRRAKDGPLGLGWTHNLDISAKVAGDSWQFLGADSATDAAAHIVSLHVSKSIEGFSSMITSLCANWLMDKMKDKNIVDIRQGSGITRFTKVVDEANDVNDVYHAPTGQTIKLLKRSNGNFRLKNTSGIFYDFDSSGRMSQWSDAHGNLVDFTYTSGKLTAVTSKLKPASGAAVTARSLTFTYTGDRITSVSDSASRSISYTYDANGQLVEFINPDGNDIDYEYVSGKKGLLWKVFSPIDKVNAILRVEYDPLGRMSQQIDANDCTWDFYRATYRNEVVGPNQLDPNDEVKRYGTVSWANPEARTVTTKDALGRVTTSRYNAQGRTDLVTGPAGTSAKFDYNADNNVIEAKGLSIPGSGDANVLKEFGYCSYGDPNNPEQRWFIHLKQQIDTTGQKGYYYYDYNEPSNPGYLGELRKVVSLPSDPAADANRPTVYFTYYPDGQLKHKKQKKDASSYIYTKFEYYTPAEGAGLKKTIADANGLNITTEVGYDSVGRVIWTKDPLGHTSQSEYSAAGRLKKTISPAPFNYETTYEYYADGKLKCVKQVLPARMIDDPHCMAFWRLEDGALTVDSQGGAPLTNSGVTASTGDYKEGAACGDFERSESDSLSIADSDLPAGFPLKSGDTNKKISVCFWMKPESLGATQYMVSKYDAANNKRSFAVVLGSGGQVGHLIGYNNGNSYEDSWSTETLSAGAWYHVGATYDDSTRAWTMRVWSNASSSIVINRSGAKTNNINVEDAAWVIGNSQNGTVYFDGLMDGIMVFNDILTNDEIDQVRQGTYGVSEETGNDFSGDSSCVALWRIESGALTTDSQGGNTLTNSGVTAETGSFMEGAGCGDFERSQSDRMLIADSSLDSGFPFKSGDTNKKISVCAWIKLESIAHQYVVSKWDYLNNKRSFAVVVNSSGQLCHYTGYNGGSSSEINASTATLSTGRWYHIAATYDDSTRAWKLLAWDDTASSLVIDMSGTKTNNINVEDSPWMLGHAGETAYFDGLMDEVVVFNDVLTNNEIDEIRQGEYRPAGSNTIVLQDITYNVRGQKATVRGPYREGAPQSEKDINYTQYAYDSLGRPWKVTDAEGHITTTRYYPDGKVWKVIDAEGHTTVTNTYNSKDGSLKEVQDAKGNVTRYLYNGFMALKNTIYAFGTGDVSSESLEYDWCRRVSKKTTRSGQTLEFAYDGFGRVKTKTVKDAEETTLNTISYTYDLLGRLLTTTDNTGTITNSYDNASRVTQIAYPGSKTVAYQYDIAGKRTRLTYPDSTYVTYEYDHLSRLTAVKNQGGTALAQYSYDARSRRTDLEYANGAGMSYEYDTANRLLSLDNFAGSGQYIYDYTYDKVGNRTTMSVTDNSGTEVHVYAYDKIYQITDVNYAAGYEDNFTDTTFTYDAAGNRVDVNDASGLTSYQSNSLNQYTSVGGLTYSYDDSGNMTYDGDGLMYAYDPQNRLTTATKIDGPLSPGCDIALSFTTDANAPWSLDTSEYTYDHDSARSGEIGDNQQTWFETTVTGPGELRFAYKLSCDSGDEYAFFIDGQYISGRAGSYDWHESGPWTITGSGPHTIRWKYMKDASGSEGSDCLWVDHIRWTGALPDGEGWDEITYTYDPAGRRIEKKVDGTTEVKFIYDGDQCVAEYSAAGTLLRKYIYGPGIDQPICMIEASGGYAGTYYYHYDALGSVVGLTNSSANMVELYEYSVYGQVAASDPNHPNRFMFTGREFDKDTGLYYYRARYYNPEIGRFLQTDPVRYEAGMNLYRYCLNSPLNWIDPSGLIPGNFPESPPLKGYESIDDAAKAASAYIAMLKHINPEQQKEGLEYFYWIYKYKDPADPNDLYGFTLPWPAGFYECEPEQMDWSAEWVPSDATIVGAGHSHPTHGLGENFSEPNDVDFAKSNARALGRSFSFFLLTPSNKLKALDVGVVTNGQEEVIGTVTRRRDIKDFDPNSPTGGVNRAPILY